MRILSTPWRMAYIKRDQRGEGCIFCGLLTDARTDEERFILHREAEAFLVLNIYPYTPGHLMAVPYRHAAGLGGLSASELEALLRLAQLGERALRRSFGCRSVHVGANIGRAAGAGVPGHVHLHVVGWPERGLWERWADAQAPPETLRETYARLRASLRGLRP
jgi:ATP adenylyltransferase